MIISDLINLIENDYPIQSSLDYDNSGSNIIEFNSNITGILITLDVSLASIEFAKKNNLNLIISHHPLIFNKIKNLNDDPVAKRIKLLNKYEINAYSCHTNFDSNLKNGMGHNLIKRVFDESNISNHLILDKYFINNEEYGIGDIITLREKTKFDDILSLFIKKLNLDHNKISFYDTGLNIKKLIIIPGSGSSDVELVLKEKPDLLVTSELKHNQILDLLESNISYINPTHYGLENIFIDSFYDYLNDKLSGNIVIKKFDIKL